jgi:hypothetical protein
MHPQLLALGPFYAFELLCICTTRAFWECARSLLNGDMHAEHAEHVKRSRKWRVTECGRLTV